MSEYSFNELVKEIANNKKSFADYVFSKNRVSNENTREIYLSACENIANIYTCYGFKYSKSGTHLTLKQKENEFIYKISFRSSHYNVPGVNIIMDVFANVLSHKYKKWKVDNKIQLGLNSVNLLDEYICGGNIGNLRKNRKYLSWNIGKIEAREVEIGSIIDSINNLAIPFFDCFNDLDKLKQEIENRNIEHHYFSAPNYLDHMVNFYIYLTKKDISEKNEIKNKLNKN